MATKKSTDDAASLAEAVMEDAREERLDSLRGPESPEGLALGRAVGENLARHRTEQGLDLRALADRSGIRIDLLEMLEGGQAVPSLRAVWYLATALAVPFGALLENTVLAEVSDPEFRVQRSDRGNVITDAAGQFRSRVLFMEGDPRMPEDYELTLDPGCVEPADAHARNTYEHIVVLRGTLIVRVGEKEARLGAGDTIFFRADVAHGYENAGDDAVVAHLVMQYAPDPH
ncbi:MAG: cupin domain-containing protein [Candidatus Binatia bacterium]